MDMKLIGKAFIVGFAAAAISVVACSSNHSTGGTGSNTHPGSNPGVGSEDSTGTVGFQYTLPGGEHLSSVAYKLTNGTNTYSGTVNVADAGAISFLVQGVLSGAGYNITLTGTTDDGQVSCIGTVGAANAYANPPGSVVGSTFNVANRATTTVNVNMICLDLANLDAGSLTVNSVTSCCATWDTAVGNPANANTTAPGNTSALSANASAPCGNTDAGTNTLLNCVWGAPTTGTGTVGTTTTDGAGNFFATFTCPTAGETDTIPLNCTDGPLPTGGSCPAWSTSTTVQVICGVPACLGVGTGVEASPNTATGACPAPSTNTGTLKDSQGNFCCSPPACQGVGSGTEATPNTSAGTCPCGQTNTLKDQQGNFCCAATLAPCTTAAMVSAGGCVTCNGNASGVCSATEAEIVSLDIKNGKICAAGAPSTVNSSSCYACLWNNDCIDNTVNGDAMKECEDFGAATVPPGGAGAGASAASTCANTFACILNGPGDACLYNTADGPSFCYCGAAGGPAASCSAAMNTAVNGPCEHLEALGFAFPEFDSKDILSNYNAVAMASGRANQILNCALSNHKNGGCDTLCK
jgi:hypothetical protein